LKWAAGKGENMKKIYLFLILILLIAPCAYGATETCTPTVYQITIQEVELRNAATSEWVTVASGSQAFNIASIYAGQAVGAYISNAGIDPGTYDGLRVTVARNISISATATIGETTYYTTATQYDNFGEPTEIQGKAISISSTGPAVTGVFQIPDGDPDDIPAGYSHVLNESAGTIVATLTGAAFTSPVTIQQDVATTLRITFDVTNKVTFDDDYDGGNPGDPSDVAYINPPLIEVSQQ